jgi:hypothetical protein
MSGEHNDVHRRELRSNSRDGGDSAHVRHLEIHQDDVGPKLATTLHRFVSVRRFAHDRQVRLVAENRSNAFPQ